MSNICKYIFPSTVNCYKDLILKQEDRSFGVIEIWMIGCQVSIFLAMIEYAVILLLLKNEHDVLKNCGPKSEKSII